MSQVAELSHRRSRVWESEPLRMSVLPHLTRLCATKSHHDLLCVHAIGLLGSPSYSQSRWGTGITAVLTTFCSSNVTLSAGWICRRIQKTNYTSHVYLSTERWLTGSEVGTLRRKGPASSTLTSSYLKAEVVHDLPSQLRVPRAARRRQKG